MAQVQERRLTLVGMDPTWEHDALVYHVLKGTGVRITDMPRRTVAYEHLNSSVQAALVLPAEALPLGQSTEEDSQLEALYLAKAHELGVPAGQLVVTQLTEPNGLRLDVKDSADQLRPLTEWVAHSLVLGEQSAAAQPLHLVS